MISNYLAAMETELFEIKLNDKGKSLLLRINFWTKFLYTCTIITCLFDLINSYTGLKGYTRLSGSYPALLKFQFLFNIFFLIAYAIVVPLQAYFFYRFAARSKKAFQYGSSEEFNESFQWLLKHAVLASLLFALNSLWAIIITIIQIKISAFYTK